jgi:AcrR family transcriptional regulator
MLPASEKILHTALAHYRRDGLQALSLRAVARDVGITPMAVYRHYRDKDALVDALVAHGFALWETRLAEAAQGRTPHSRIVRALEAYAEFALDEPRLFELMFLVPRAKIPGAPGSLAVTPSPSFGILIASVHEAMQRGEMIHGDPTETILLAWATAHGLVALHFSGRFGHDAAAFRAVYDRTIRKLLKLLSA